MKKILGLLLTLSVTFTLVSCTGSGKNGPGTDNYVQGERVSIADTGITWPEGQLLPSFAPVAEKLDSLNANGLTVSLQGIVNRTKPRIICLASPSEGVNTWPEALGVPYERISQDDAILKYISEIKGIVVYDDGLSDTFNLAETFAGLNDCIVCSPKEAEKYSQAPYNLEIKENYNDRFEDKLEVYNYLYENLWPETEKRILVGVKPTDRTCIRDMAVATKSAIVWLDSMVAEERSLLSKFFNDMEVGKAMYVGWWVDEPNGVAFSGGEHGIPTLAADYFENYTVYSGTDRCIIKNPMPQTPELENKVYISFMMSEGDNIQYCQHGLRNKWDEEGRGRIPVSWTCSPMLLDAAPVILNWYYANATEMDCLVVGPSGAGYSSLNDWSNEEWMKAFVDNTDRYLRKTGFQAITVWYSVNDVWGSLFAEKCKTLLGITAQSSVSASIYQDMPAISLLQAYVGDNIEETVINSIRDEVAKWDGKSPLFIGIQGNSWAARINDFVKISETLGDDIYEYVRLDQMLALYREYYGLPYNAALYKNVEATGADEGYEASLALNGSNTGKWQSSLDGTKSLTVDLGSEMYVTRYLIQHAEAGGEDPSLNTKSFSIEVSKDGESWEKVDWVNDNTQDMTDRSIEKVIARYVRLNVIDGGADGKARIYNFEVYASNSDRFIKSAADQSVTRETGRVSENYVVAGAGTGEGSYLVAGGIEVEGLLEGTHHVNVEMGTLDTTEADAELIEIEIYDKGTGELLNSEKVLGSQFFGSNDIRLVTASFDVDKEEMVIEVKIKLSGGGYVKLGNISVF